MGKLRPAAPRFLFALRIPNPEVLSPDIYGAGRTGPFGPVAEAISLTDDLRDAFRERSLGQEFDVETNLLLRGGRMLDPGSGRLLNVGPPGASLGDPNPYNFAGNAPANVASTGFTLQVGASGTGFWELYSHYLNPANNDGHWSDNIFMVGKYAGWAAFAVGGAGAGAVGASVAVASAASGLGIGLSSAGAGAIGTSLAALGIGKALAPVLANNPNAGFHEYAGAIGGGGMSMINPVSGLLSVGGAAIGGGIETALGGSFYGKGYDYGDRIGGLIGSLAETGIDAYGRAGTLDYVRQAAGVHAAGTVIGGWIGYGVTGTFDGALAGAEYGDMAGNIASSLLVACFTSDTRLVVPEGLKRIDAFRAGDLVGSRSEQNPDGPLEWKRVLRVFRRLAPIVELTVGGRVIRTTLEHPFRPVEGGWTPAGELELGQLLVTLQGAGVPVESLRATGEMATVYNLEVEDHHTYFVSGDDWGFAVWAHNAKCLPTGHPPTRKQHGSIPHNDRMIAEAVPVGNRHAEMPSGVVALETRTNQAILNPANRSGPALSPLRPDNQSLGTDGLLYFTEINRTGGAGYHALREAQLRAASGQSFGGYKPVDIR